MPVDLAAELAATFEELRDPYIDYCQHVSRRSMAINIETATLVLYYCRLREPFAVCDLGSDRKSTRLNSSHSRASRMPSSA